MHKSAELGGLQQFCPPSLGCRPLQGVGSVVGSMWIASTFLRGLPSRTTGCKPRTGTSWLTIRCCSSPKARAAVSEATVKRLHEFIRGDIWDAGKYKQKDGDIIEKYADGRHRVRFKPVTAGKNRNWVTSLNMGTKLGTTNRTCPRRSREKGP